MPPTVLSRDIGSRFIQALTSGSINDITYEQMNRIIRRLKTMTTGTRTGVKVGRVIVEELGVQKANEYIEKALAQGLLSNKEYEEMKATVLFQVPREQLPSSWAGRGRQELLAGQKKIQKDVAQLTEQGRKAIEAPLRAFNKDVERLKKAWGK